MIYFILLIGGLFLLGFIFVLSFTDNISYKSDPFQTLFFAMEATEQKRSFNTKNIFIKPTKKGYIFYYNNYQSLFEISHYLSIDYNDLKNLYLKYGAKQKYIFKSWRVVEKSFCFESKQKINSLIDNEIIPKEVMKRLISS